MSYLRPALVLIDARSGHTHPTRPAVPPTAVHMPSNYHTHLSVDQLAFRRSTSDFSFLQGSMPDKVAERTDLPVALHCREAVGICGRVSWK